MGLITIKMEWDLCSSPACVPFYLYTMFQNPILNLPVNNYRKLIITGNKYIDHTELE